MMFDDGDDDSDGHAGGDGDAGMARHLKLYLTKRSIFPGWIDPVLSTATLANNTATAIWRSTKYATHSLLFANQNNLFAWGEIGRAHV